MKNFLNKIKQHLGFLFFVFLFAYIMVIYTRIMARRVIDISTFEIWAVFGLFLSACVLFLVIAFFIKCWQKSAVFTKKEMLKIFCTSIFVFLFVINVTSFLIALKFGTIERNFNKEEVTFNTFFFLLNGIIFGSFFLVYYYYRKNKKQQKQLITYNQALSESRINQLKMQLNPHFLFNNLNVLDQLIEEDKCKASDFLNEFAEIYRYVLQVSDKKLVPISEELTFVEKYFNLIKHKYGNAYQLKIESKNIKGEIVPLTLQLLVENAVNHNLGTELKPVHIEIYIDEKIIVSNNIIPKQHTKHTSGRALNNLKEQYALLSNDRIEIEKSDKNFIVTLPIIPIQEQ
jgi:sensor histidine kinase YesM